MKKFYLIMVLILVGLLITSFTIVRSQEQYWIALNFVIKFYDNGVVIVIAKMHPFTAEGVSLYNNPAIAQEMRSMEGQLIEEILLMFTKYPKRIKYTILSHIYKNDTMTVLCDIHNTGKMSILKGAYVFSLKIYLNTSEFVRKITDHIYEVKIRDSYTSQDPRSWIDVLEVVFEQNVKLINYTWLPSIAHGPKYKTKNSFLWINYNEIQAPDYYIFYLEIPYLEISTKPPLQGVIKAVYRTGNVVEVKVYNKSPQGGFFTLNFIQGNIQQARKIYVDSHKSSVVHFYLNNIKGHAVVQLISGSVVLEEKRVNLETLPPPPPISNEYLSITSNYYMLASIALIIAGLFLIVVALLRRSTIRKGTSEEYSYELNLGYQ